MPDEFLVSGDRWSESASRPRSARAFGTPMRSAICRPVSATSADAEIWRQFGPRQHDSVRGFATERRVLVKAPDGFARPDDALTAGGLLQRTRIVFDPTR